MKTMYHETATDYRGHSILTIFTETTSARQYIHMDANIAEKQYRREFNLQRVPFHHVYIYNGYVTFEK